MKGLVQYRVRIKRELSVLLSIKTVLKVNFLSLVICNVHQKGGKRYNDVDRTRFEKVTCLYGKQSWRQERF